MANTFTQLIEGTQLAATAGTLYTAPDGRSAYVTNMTLTNTTSGAITATLYNVESGGTAGDANTILKAKSLAAGETYRVTEFIGKVVGSGGTIKGLASAAASISIEAGGIEQA